MVGFRSGQVLYVPGRGRQRVERAGVKEPDVSVGLLHGQRATTAEDGFGGFVLLEAPHFVFAPLRPVFVPQEGEQAFLVGRAVDHRGDREDEDVLGLQVMDGSVSQRADALEAMSFIGNDTEEDAVTVGVEQVKLLC